jgi:hypothetical protein
VAQSTKTNSISSENFLLQLSKKLLLVFKDLQADLAMASGRERHEAGYEFHDWFADRSTEIRNAGQALAALVLKPPDEMLTGDFIALTICSFGSDTLFFQKRLLWRVEPQESVESAAPGAHGQTKKCAKCGQLSAADASPKMRPMSFDEIESRGNEQGVRAGQGLGLLHDPMIVTLAVHEVFLSPNMCCVCPADSPEISNVCMAQDFNALLLAPDQFRKDIDILLVALRRKEKDPAPDLDAITYNLDEGNVELVKEVTSLRDDFEVLLQVLVYWKYFRDRQTTQEEKRDYQQQLQRVHISSVFEEIGGFRDSYLHSVKDAREQTAQTTVAMMKAMFTHPETWEALFCLAHLADEPLAAWTEKERDHRLFFGAPRSNKDKDTKETLFPALAAVNPKLCAKHNMFIAPLEDRPSEDSNGRAEEWQENHRNAHCIKLQVNTDNIVVENNSPWKVGILESCQCRPQKGWKIQTRVSHCQFGREGVDGKRVDDIISRLPAQAEWSDEVGSDGAPPPIKYPMEGLPDIDKTDKWPQLQALPRIASFKYAATESYTFMVLPLQTMVQIIVFLSTCKDYNHFSRRKNKLFAFMSKDERKETIDELMYDKEDWGDWDLANAKKNAKKEQDESLPLSKRCWQSHLLQKLPDENDEKGVYMFPDIVEQWERDWENWCDQKKDTPRRFFYQNSFEALWTKRVPTLPLRPSKTYDALKVFLLCLLDRLGHLHLLYPELGEESESATQAYNHTSTTDEPQPEHQPGNELSSPSVESAQINLYEKQLCAFLHDNHVRQLLCAEYSDAQVIRGTSGMQSEMHELLRHPSEYELDPTQQKNLHDKNLQLAHFFKVLRGDKAFIQLHRIHCSLQLSAGRINREQSISFDQFCELMFVAKNEATTEFSFSDFSLSTRKAAINSLFWSRHIRSVDKRVPDYIYSEEAKRKEEREKQRQTACLEASPEMIHAAVMRHGTVLRFMAPIFVRAQLEGKTAPELREIATDMAESKDIPDRLNQAAFSELQQDDLNRSKTSLVEIVLKRQANEFALVDAAVTCGHSVRRPDGHEWDDLSGLEFQHASELFLQCGSGMREGEARTSEADRLPLVILLRAVGAAGAALEWLQKDAWLRDSSLGREVCLLAVCSKYQVDVPLQLKTRENLLSDPVEQEAYVQGYLDVVFDELRAALQATLQEHGLTGRRKIYVNRDVLSGDLEWLYGPDSVIDGGNAEGAFPRREHLKGYGEKACPGIASMAPGMHAITPGLMFKVSTNPGNSSKGSYRLEFGLASYKLLRSLDTNIGRAKPEHDQTPDVKLRIRFACVSQILTEATIKLCIQKAIKNKKLTGEMQLQSSTYAGQSAPEVTRVQQTDGMSLRHVPWMWRTRESDGVRPWYENVEALRALVTVPGVTKQAAAEILNTANSLESSPTLQAYAYKIAEAAVACNGTAVKYVPIDLIQRREFEQALADFDYKPEMQIDILHRCSTHICSAIQCTKSQNFKKAADDWLKATQKVAAIGDSHRRVSGMEHHTLHTSIGRIRLETHPYAAPLFDKCVLEDHANEVLKSVYTADMADLRNLVHVAVKQNGLAAQYLPNRFRGDQATMLSAVNQNGRALVFAHPQLASDPLIVVAATASSHDAIAFASDNFFEYFQERVQQICYDEHENAGGVSTGVGADEATIRYNPLLLTLRSNRKFMFQTLVETSSGGLSFRDDFGSKCFQNSLQAKIQKQLQEPFSRKDFDKFMLHKDSEFMKSMARNDYRCNSYVACADAATPGKLPRVWRATHALRLLAYLQQLKIAGVDFSEHKNGMLQAVCFGFDSEYSFDGGIKMTAVANLFSDNEGAPYPKDQYNFYREAMRQYGFAYAWLPEEWQNHNLELDSLSEHLGRWAIEDEPAIFMTHIHKKLTVNRQSNLYQSYVHTTARRSQNFRLAIEGEDKDDILKVPTHQRKETISNLRIYAALKPEEEEELANVQEVDDTGAHRDTIVSVCTEELGLWELVRAS